MSHDQLNLTNDELLSTTRAVRKRLDFDRPVPMSVVKECMEMAVQAPSGSNAQGWQFMFVTDPDKRAQIGEYYRQAFEIYKDMPVAIHKLHADSADTSLTSSQVRSASSADFLGENMGRAPVLMIPVLPVERTMKRAPMCCHKPQPWVLLCQRLGALCWRRALGVLVRLGRPCI